MVHADVDILALAYMCFIYLNIIVCMSGFDLIHTYSSDALAQGIVKYILYVCRVLT